MKFSQSMQELLSGNGHKIMEYLPVHFSTNRMDSGDRKKHRKNRKAKERI